MATRKKDIVEEQAVEETALVVVAGSNELPDYLRDYTGATGTEDIDNADVTIPRIKLVQDMTDVAKDGTVKPGSFILNIDNRVLAGPGEELIVVPVARGTEYILWADRQEGGGILARAKTEANGKHRWNKELGTAFETKLKGVQKVKWVIDAEYVEDGKLGNWGSQVPGDPDSGIAATKHHNYVVYLPQLDLVAALSLSRTAASKAKDWNALLKLSPAPMFARQFALASMVQTKGNDSWHNYKLVPKGFVDPSVFVRTKELFEGFRAEGFTVDQSQDDGEPASKAAEMAGDKF